MTSLKSANRRVGSLFAVAALVLATVTPGLVPAFASAAQLSERSVTLSSSSVEMDDVSYRIDFTAISSFSAVALDFCSNTPLIGSACTPPSDFNVAAATTPTAGYSVYADGVADDDNTIVLANSGSVAAGARTIELEGVTNPDTTGPLYVRIVTYATDANAGAYVSNTLPGTGAVDQGSAAASITDTVGVSGAVLETMTFCVSGAEITTEDCATVSPTALELGEPSGGVVALSAGAVSEADIYSQISTNAASGAVVNMQSSAAGCGGLLRAGAEDECDIAPTTTGIVEGSALFGLKVATATNPGDGSNSNGAFAAAGGGTPFYNNSTFKINYNDTDESDGVTSPYGDPVLDTAGAPVNNKNARITFGASIANNTPAGRYSADFSLIATGKF